MAGKQRDVGYEAIADGLRARIANGDLPPGATVPGEKELMAANGVSRETAYKALQLLRDEGLTYGRQGAPTRVRLFNPIRRRANRRLSSEIWGGGASMWGIDVRDQEPEVVDLSVRRIEASVKVAESLGISRGQAVIQRARTYVLDGKPVLRAVSHLPADLADGTQIVEADTGPGGIYARLKDLGHAPVLFREEVRARMPSREEKAILKLDRGTPLICVVRTARSSEGRVVEVNEMLLDGASYILDYEIPA